MPPEVRTAIWWLGATQCVAWGVLYYGFSVWLLPMQASSGLPASVVGAAFSLGLLLAALLAPRVGRAFDQGRGRAVLRMGTVSALLGLLALVTSQKPWVLFPAWALLGVAMAALLYEPAFALVHRAVADPGGRLRALAAVTVMGGLASTIFLPLLGALAEVMGLRASLLAGTAALLVSAWALERRVLPALAADERTLSLASAPVPIHGSNWRPLALVFSSGTVCAMALTSLLVLHLAAAGQRVSVAASVLAVLGIAQLPGRLWLLRGGRRPSLQSLAVAPLLLQSAGLLVVALSASAIPATLGVALFGLGAGLQTLARPWLVQSRFGAAAGHVNGCVARWQGIGRAAAPFAALAVAAAMGSRAVLLGLSAMLLATLPLASRLARGPGLATPPPAPR